MVIVPYCPTLFSTVRFWSPPKPNSAAVISLFPSTPAQESVSSSGVFPISGLTESPRHVGTTFLGVGVGVMLEVGVSVGVSVGVRVPVGVAVGVMVSARFRSSKVDRPDFATAITLKVTLTRRIRKSERLNGEFFLIFFDILRLAFMR